MNDVRNFKEVFRKDVTYDNIKSLKKSGLQHLSRSTFLEEPQEWKIPILFEICKLECLNSAFFEIHL